MDGPRTILCKCFVYWNSWTNITHSCLLVTTRWPLGKHWVTTPLWEVTDTSIKSSSFTNQNQIKPSSDKNLGLVTRRGPEGRGLGLILLLVTDWLTDVKGPAWPPWWLTGQHDPGWLTMGGWWGQCSHYHIVPLWCQHTRETQFNAIIGNNDLKNIQILHLLLIRQQWWCGANNEFLIAWLSVTTGPQV